MLAFGVASHPLKILAVLWGLPLRAHAGQGWFFLHTLSVLVFGILIEVSNGILTVSVQYLLCVRISTNPGVDPVGKIKSMVSL